ncbi:F-box-like protein [Ceratobasidium sp. AG-Ba]|nr:F-box-like protein [Ceratobasidium sp. AG-Ba]
MQLLSAHSVSALYWRKCYVEGAHLEPIGIKPTASEADLRFLSALASKVPNPLGVLPTKYTAASKCFPKAMSSSDYPIASEESLMGTMDIDTDFATYGFACERLQSAHAALCTAAQEYLAASLLVRSTYSGGSHGSDKPPQEREAMLLAIDTELATIPSEIETISLALSTIKSTRDQSKMVAPIYSLPSELLARIFCNASCHCTQIFVHYSLGLGNTNPTILSGVCRRWRAVALGHISLWTHLDLVVSRRDTGCRYPSSELWLERLQDAPLYVNIRQYHSFDQDEWDEEELENDSDDERNPAEMVTSLLDFLTPLIIQMRSLTILLGWPAQYILTALLDRWKDYGVSEDAKILKVESNLEIY